MLHKVQLRGQLFLLGLLLLQFTIEGICHPALPDLFDEVPDLGFHEGELSFEGEALLRELCLKVANLAKGSLHGFGNHLLIEHLIEGLEEGPIQPGLGLPHGILADRWLSVMMKVAHVKAVPFSRFPLEADEGAPADAALGHAAQQIQGAQVGP